MDLNKIHCGIMVDNELIEWAKNGGIEPFDPMLVNPASIDLRWSGRYRRAISTPKRWGRVRTIDKLVMGKDELYLLDTLETIKMPDNTVGFLMLKSSSGRKGLEHLHAGLFDPGFYGTGTLEMENRHPYPVTIEPGQAIIQLCLIKTGSMPTLTYEVTGRYNGQSSPEPERVE